MTTRAHEPHPNAIIRSPAAPRHARQRRTIRAPHGAVRRLRQRQHDAPPTTGRTCSTIRARDAARRRRDRGAGGRRTATMPYLGGVMHYVELDVSNLRRWLERHDRRRVRRRRQHDGHHRLRRSTSRTGATQPRTRGATARARTGDDDETGEFGFEDIVNRGRREQRPNGTPARRRRGLQRQRVRAGGCRYGGDTAPRPAALAPLTTPATVRTPGATAIVAHGEPAVLLPARAEARERRPGNCRPAPGPDRRREPVYVRGTTTPAR